jgi:UDP-GlcNAc:undecaprenyl-phosphate GlcNAc-1-phosphate transferase
MIWIVAFAASVAATWLVRRLARRLGLMAQPSPLVPQHRVPVAYLGGAGIAIGFAVALAVARPALDGRAAAFLVPGLGFLVLGLIDDLRPFRPIAKLTWQTLLAVVAVSLGVQATVTGIGLVDSALAVMWIVLLTNAANVTDVCDGLAGGIAAVGLVYLGLVSSEARLFAWPLAAACVGFLVFNRPPASIFMGDAGSLLLGFALAALSMRVLEVQPLWPGIPMAVAAGALFVFEALFLIVIRPTKGMPFWKGSRDHFSLRMQAAGWSKWRTDLASWTIAATVCFIAWSLPTSSFAAQVTLVAALLAATGGFVVWLLRHEAALHRPQPNLAAEMPPRAKVG